MMDLAFWSPGDRGSPQVEISGFAAKENPARRAILSCIRIVLLVFVVAGWGLASQGDTLFLPSDDNVVYQGRWDRTQSESAITVYPGAGFRAGFTGNHCVLRFDTAPYSDNRPPQVWLQVDNGEWQVSVVQSELRILAGNSGSEEHSLELILKSYNVARQRWTPPLEAVVIFQGISLPEGERLRPGRHPTGPRVEVLGDSITEGLIVYPNQNNANIEDISDARESYAFRAAQEWDADLRITAFSGQGLLTGGNGGVPEVINTFDWIYKGVPRDSWQADWVLINLGTNDAYSTSRTFQGFYEYLLKSVRAAYPQALIFCLRPFNGTQSQGVENAVHAMRGQGDSAIHYVDTTGWLNPSDTTDTIHPSVEGHAKAAERLIEVLRDYHPTGITDYCFY